MAMQLGPPAFIVAHHPRPTQVAAVAGGMLGDNPTPKSAASSSSAAARQRKKCKFRCARILNTTPYPQTHEKARPRAPRKDPIRIR